MAKKKRLYNDPVATALVYHYQGTIKKKSKEKSPKTSKKKISPYQKHVIISYGRNKYLRMSILQHIFSKIELYGGETSDNLDYG